MNQHNYRKLEKRRSQIVGRLRGEDPDRDDEEDDDNNNYNNNNNSSSELYSGSVGNQFISDLEHIIVSTCWGGIQIAIYASTAKPEAQNWIENLFWMQIWMLT